MYKKKSIIKAQKITHTIRITNKENESVLISYQYTREENLISIKRKTKKI